MVLGRNSAKLSLSQTDHSEIQAAVDLLYICEGLWGFCVVKKCAWGITTSDVSAASTGNFHEFFLSISQNRYLFSLRVVSKKSQKCPALHLHVQFFFFFKKKAIKDNWKYWFACTTQKQAMWKTLSCLSWKMLTYLFSLSVRSTAYRRWVCQHNANRSAFAYLSILKLSHLHSQSWIQVCSLSIQTLFPSLQNMIFPPTFYSFWC